MNKNKLIKTALTVIVPVIILIAIIVIRYKVTTSDEFSLAKYIIIKTEGLDGNASATASLDEVGLYAALAGVDAADSDREVYNEFVNSITYTIDKDSSLSNGDYITINVEYNETLAQKLNIKVDKTSRRSKITGLKDGQALDAFKDLQIITSGTSPYVCVTYVNNSDNEYLKSLEYDVNKTSGLAIGDEIIITCKSDDAVAAQEGYYISDKELKYTITKADRYISEPSQMDMSIVDGVVDEDIAVITELTEDTTTHMSYEVTGDRAYLFRDNNEEARGFTLDRTLLGYNNSGYEQEHENYIVVIFKGQLVLPTYTDGDDPYEYIDAYFAFLYPDAVVTTDGEVSLTTDNPKQRYVCGTSYDNVMQAVVSVTGSGYDYQEITD